MSTPVELSKAKDRYARLRDAAVELAYRRASDIDAEFGCCHSIEDFRAGGRLPEFDGDEFQPIPSDCTGARVLADDLRALLAAVDS
jgi:hypothetical protein